jgi:cytochrome bd ubiquinol oxidase subunit I
MPDVALLADSGSNLLAARNQMAFTLGFHIVLACFGVAFPLVMLTAEWYGHRKQDPDALRLARNWSKAVAVLFAVGAVTGTVLSFEFGLLWPRFTDRFGDVFGIGFAIEGIFFFLEAIFIAIYIYGWDRLSPRAHMLSAVPIVISGIGGAFSVISVNAWMNQPQGFDLNSAGEVTNVRPFEVIFNPATGYEFFHMWLAAYMVTGFLIASVYAVGMLKGRRDRYHRLGFLIPFTIAAIATPIQIFVGDTAARAVADDQPAKFAAFECVYESGDNQTEYIGGICTDDEVKGAIGIPGLDSLLVGFSTDTYVKGLDQVPDDQEPPALTLLHLSFDTMVGIGTALFLLAVWFAISWWRRRDIPATPWFLRAAAVSGVGAILALEAGWIVTEVGRQPWIVYEFMRTEDAVTPAQGIWWVFGLTMLLYVGLGVTAITVLRALSRRWREGRPEEPGEIPYGPPADERSGAST